MRTYQVRQRQKIFIKNENNTVLVREQMFIIYYDDRTKTPIWIGEWVTKNGKNS